MATKITSELPSLSPAARHGAAIRVLELVAQHDGQWSWYQLDRSLSSEFPGPFFVEIDALIAAGLVVEQPAATPGMARYSLSPSGQSLFVVHGA